MKLAIVLFSICLARGACLPVAGEHILGSDLASANPVFGTLLPGQVISFSPAPGTQRTLSTRELERIAVKFAIPDAADAQLAPICLERLLETIEPAAMTAVMATTLAVSPDQIEVIDFIRARVPPGQMEFPRTGLEKVPGVADSTVLWRGRIVYDHGRTMPIWAKVKVLVEAPVVAALVNIGAGQVIQADQIGMVMQKQFPPVPGVVSSPDQAIGKKARRAIPAGTPIAISLLDQPREVTQGDVVQVVAAEGQAQITFEARAQTGGRKGDVILVQNPSGGRTFKATIVDKGKVAVRSSGV